MAILTIRCPQCRRKYAGTIVESPICSKCGFQISKEAMAPDLEQVKQFQDYLRERRRKRESN